MRFLDKVSIIFSRRVSGMAAAGMAAAALALAASSAQASEASKIIQRCGHGESIQGFKQSAYRQALKQMPTELVEYSPCESLIRKAELAAAGGGSGGPGSGSAAELSSTPIPLTPAERHSVEEAHHHGAAPLAVNGKAVSPGVVHANIASAVSTLPHSLFAVLALMLASAAVLIGGEARKRVRARRHR